MIFAIFASSLAQSVTNGSIPICLSEKPPHWNNDFLSFLLEIPDKYIFIEKINILIDNLEKANVQLQRS